jgi:Uma2 family endonuclease
MASALAKKRPATYADLFALPENVVGEIVDGELIVSPRPAPRHTIAASNLGVEIGGPFGRRLGGPGGWLILFEPELHLGEQILVPDLAGWLRERMPRMPETAWFELRPDWVCEVLSPSTAILDRTRKQEIYRQHGVPWLWFVDPAARTVEVLKLSGQDLIVAGTFGGDGEMRVPPFDAVAIDVGALWDSPPPVPGGSEDKG